MAIRIPKDAAKEGRKRTEMTPVKEKPVKEPLQSEDTIEYGITMEVSPSPGRKAWIRVGTTSSVRGDETTEQAKRRIYDFVDGELDARLEELS